MIKPLFSKRPKYVRDVAKANTLILVDTNNLVHRAANAYQLTTSEGIPSGHVYGCLRMLMPTLKKGMGKPPICIVMAADGRPRWRYKLFPGYKAARRASDGTPEKAHKDTLRFEGTSVLHAMPGVVAYHPEAEADDVIATLARQARRAGKHVFILSNDRDLWQLIAIGCHVYAEGKVISEAEATKKLGFHPKKLHLAKAVYGDSSDQIPGTRSGFIFTREQFASWSVEDPIRLQKHLVNVLKDDKKRLARMTDEWWKTLSRNWKLTELQDVKGMTLKPCGNAAVLEAFLELYECTSLVPWARSIINESELSP